MLPNITPSASPLAPTDATVEEGSVTYSMGSQATARERLVQAGPSSACPPSNAPAPDQRTRTSTPAPLNARLATYGHGLSGLDAHARDVGVWPVMASADCLDTGAATRALSGDASELRLADPMETTSTHDGGASTPSHPARESREPSDAASKSTNRRGRDEALLDSPGDGRKRKRLRTDDDGRVQDDFRSILETEVDHTNGLSRVDFLGFYDDAPTLNMLTDLELFLFNQRQRWFDLGRLHSWNRFEDELARREQDSPTRPSECSQDASDELRHIIRSLTAKNQYLSDKLAATVSDLADLQSRADDGRRRALEQSRQNDDLRVALDRSRREVELLASELDGLRRAQGAPFGPSKSIDAREDIVSRVPESAERPVHAERVLRGSIDVGLAPEDVLGAFNPDTTPYDQLDFIEKSLEVELANMTRRHDALQVFPAPQRRIPGHFVWSTEEYNLPVPLGKFGQPHWAGSAWEDFNPIRLWKDVDGGKVDRGDALWIRLAEDAVRLPFEFRSNAQRIVVSEAHRFKASNWSKPLLPAGNDVAEVDVWNQCVHNALSLPLAIRRQYSYHPFTRTLYREWDAADLGIYLILRACGPENRSKKEKRLNAEGGQASKWSSWSEQVRAALRWADTNRDVWRIQLQNAGRGAGHDMDHTRPRRYCGSGDASDVFLHLLRCGFNEKRMLQLGDVYEYMERAEHLEAKLQELKLKVVAEEKGLSDHNVILARAKCRMEMEDQRIPSSHPLVRCKVKTGDPVAAEHVKILESTM